MGQAYGARRGEGQDFDEFAKRMTYLIDPHGIVRRVYEVQDVATHPEVVLADILSGAGH